MKAIDIEWDTDGDKEVLDELPTEIQIPDELTKNADKDSYYDEISDYISDVTGFCNYGFRLID